MVIPPLLHGGEGVDNINHKLVMWELRFRQSRRHNLLTQLVVDGGWGKIAC